tara:strand:+ start:20116 stop:24057 length:3942 start_codon:yes stop_codon:yes gene_type:complete
MAEVKNAFIKSKMNRDLDARLIPSGEYREAFNAQISRSEGDDVGTLENILGNSIAPDGNNVLTGEAQFEAGEAYASNLTAIGYTVDERNDCIYIFLTDGTRQSKTDPFVTSPNSGSNHFIYKYDAANNLSTKLVSGAFLNFSKNFPIYGINLIEDLLFFTDNFNQPRKINVTTAYNDTTYYTTEDQISVAKYNPWPAIQLYQDSTVSPGDYETTMKDVVSKFLPNGGTALSTNAVAGLTTFPIQDIEIPFYPALQSTTSANEPQAGMRVGVITAASQYKGVITDTGLTVVDYTSPPDLELSGAITLAQNDQLVFNFNPYYDNQYAGDSRFLEDKFVRFSYRFRYDDNEYSIFAPFTQPCFIPKQDGYFLNTEQNLGDQQSTFGSTIVDFMENKLNQIDLKIPLPCVGGSLSSEYKVKELDIIFKESNSLAVQVVETVPIDTIASQAASSSTYTYTYINKEPFKTLPEADLIRVYDKTPVKALSQEIVSNRVVYGNYQNKHTPPASIDYYVSVGEKEAFDLNTGTADTDGAFITATTVNLTNLSTGFTPLVGQQVTGAGIAADTLVVSYAAPLLTLNKNQTGVITGTTLTFATIGEDTDKTGIIEYPSSSVKTNRTYQVGVVLSDRYGRQSSVILSNNNDVVTINDIAYSGDTVYSPYPDNSNLANGIHKWPGNSLKMSFNSEITGSGNFWPGIYNGDITSTDYNPLGWYTYKIVVKQTEQEYYNVYTAGVMQDNPFDYSTSAPPTSVAPINANTSFVTLINDNINKVPRDLSEVGPQDKTFRSSVILFGRVANNTANYSNTGNEQFYPQRQSFTTNAIEDLFDLFDVLQFTQGTTVVPITDPTSPFSAFYKADSNPFVGEFVTSQDANFQFGVFNTKTINDYNKIENLAILETAPTVSRLDIYWETSSSGIISDLNNAVSNAPTTATARFDSFNTTPFQENISTGSDILASNFEIVDSFGVEYDPTVYNAGAGDGDGIIVTLTSVKNAAGTEVHSIPSPYFTLTNPVDTATDKEFNVQVTSDFTNNIYYGADANVRNFTFTFNVTLNDGVNPATTTIIEKTANLSNITVSLFESNGTTPLPATENLGIQAVPASGYGLVKAMKSKNGSGPATSGEELTWTILSVLNGTTNVSSQNYFQLTTSATSSISSCNLEVINTIPADPTSGYDVTIQCSDGGGAAQTYVCNVKFGTVPASVKQIEMEDAGPDGERPLDVVVVEVNDQPAVNGTNGYYVYDGDWNDLQTEATFGTITLDFTNASTTTACGSNPRQWFFSSVSRAQATETVWDDCANGGSGYVEGSVSNINTSGYAFNINF